MKEKKKTDAESISISMLERESDGELFLGLKLGGEEIVVDQDTACDIFDKIGDFLDLCGCFDDEEGEDVCVLH